MKGYEWIGWTATVYLIFTIINRVLGSGFLSAEDIIIMNKLSVTQNVEIGFFSIPIPNISFMNGVMNMLQGNYTFFGGNAQFFYFLFQTVTFMIGFFIVVTLISIAVNAIRGR